MINLNTIAFYSILLIIIICDNFVNIESVGGNGDDIDVMEMMFRSKRGENPQTVTLELRDEEPDDDSIVEIACSRNFKSMTNTLHRESLCRPPRKTLVPVKMPSKYYMPGVLHRPVSYTVDRCDGVCHHPNHKCLPIEKDVVEVPVTSAFIYSRLLNGDKKQKQIPQEKCMNVKIERHILCGCKCTMTESNCNEKQAFSQDRCACECRDTSKGKTCSQMNRMWDNEKCDCVCPPTASRNCSSGALFNEETCRCIQTNESPD